ncbi:hypothetical protein [Arthrobacter sp. HMWF013]|uniref:hypothetical protein n=1 Tax=Arthrobacter sp. HMWF013 TaxID=2056849 RepID=UPI0026D7A90B
MRANEARYYSTRYGHVFTVSPAGEVPEVVDRVSRILQEERDIVFGSRPLAGVIRGSYFVIKGEY